MSDIPPINVTSSLGINVVEREQSFGPERVPEEGPVDRVEISDAGQALGALGNDAPIRAEKVAAIREAIASGQYETPDKIDRTVDRLMRVLSHRN